MNYTPTLGKKWELGSDSKLLDFQILDYSDLFFQIPGLPGGLEFVQEKVINGEKTEKSKTIAADVHQKSHFH
jgi:hypothetical protein